LFSFLLCLLTDVREKAAGLRSREKMVYGNEVLHKSLSGAIGASRLKLLGRMRRKPARLPPIWGSRPFPTVLASF
jgi:hypothetical protein